MLPAELKKIAESMPADKGILCQVVGTHGGAWNCEMIFTPAQDLSPSASFNLLTVVNPGLKYLPDITDVPVKMGLCKNKHRFAMLPDHPKRNDTPLCPYCMASNQS